ncbi:unnamed protein product [Rhizoctonia solani]|uniref:Uncharacterized protein n=1 Tax=Rhizoctonia solani TaxID=456999 RepID=A0A8H3DAS8_9AGAM|nr:unnamed protein product [Rhizoctonia solani]
MYQKMFSSGDPDVYVPSEAGSSMTVFHTPPQTPRKAPRMVMEVVIPTRKSTKQYSSSPVNERTESTTLRSRRTRVREPSPARSDSSISLGSYMYRSPKKKRTWRRKRPSTTAEGEQARPRKPRNRKCDKQRAATEASQHEHTRVSVPPLAAPITADPQFYPRSPSISPFKSRASLPSIVPGLKININLESARLETIQAQESARGYDIYHYWPTPPGSGSAKARVGNALNTPTASSSPEPRAPLYAPLEAGSSTGLGTQEHDKLYEEPRWTPWKSVPAPQNLGVPSNLTPFSPLTTDRSHPSFAETVEAELYTASPEVNKLARLGLQTALAELVDRYDYPLEGVSKLYRSKGCLEETERVLRQLRSTADDLIAMTNAAFAVE